MARRAAFVDSQRVAAPDLILVDAGDFFHRKGQEYDAQSTAVWLEMVRLGYDAVALGELGIRHWKLTDSLMQICPLPLVSTNLEIFRDEEWHPVGAPYRIFDKGAVRVGVISVIDETFFSSHSFDQIGQENVRILDPLATTRRVAAELREHADLVLLLAQLTGEAMQTLADSLQNVDIMVGGNRVPADEEPARMGNLIVNRSGARGMRVAVTNLILNPQNEILSFSGPNVMLTEELPEDSLVTAAAEAAKTEMVERRKARMQRMRNARQARQEEMERRRQERREQGLDH